MRVAALHRQSLIDYPGVLACVIFTRGCNFRCWYCHNPWLVLPELNSSEIPVATVLEFLEHRKKWLEGVVISGGEPTLHNDLPLFISKIKQMGFRVKIDTNGTNPSMLQQLIGSGLVDFVAMDIKAKPETGSYQSVIGVPEDSFLKKIRESIKVILNSRIEHQFRITLLEGVHTAEDIEFIQQHFINNEKLTINAFNRENGILSDFLKIKV